VRRVPQRDRRRGGGSSSGHCGRDGDATTAARLAITKVNLAGSLVGGTIAAAVGAMGDLEYLVLGFNNLSGSVPAAVGTLPKLSVLWLSDNHLGGALPHLPYARLHTRATATWTRTTSAAPSRPVQNSTARFATAPMLVPSTGKPAPRAFTRRTVQLLAKSFRRL